jgi:hypothetical protein
MAMDSKPPSTGGPLAGAERRGTRRKKALLSGIAVSTDGVFTAPCVIRTISDSGATIKASATRAITGRTFLIVPLKERVYEAEVKWARDGEYGLKFIASHSNASLDANGLQFLRRLLAERLPRNFAD